MNHTVQVLASKIRLLFDPASWTRTRLLQVGLIVVTLAALIGAYALFPSFRTGISVSEPTPTPYPTPTPIPLPAGPQTYQISSQGTGIKITKAVFDPLDAPVNTSQTIVVTASDTVGIASMSATFMGDTGKVSVPLKLSSGTNKEGTWLATWTVTMPHTRLYSTALTAFNGKTPVTVDLWFR